MNELEETLKKILEKSIELAEQTGEFVVAQGTELLQQFFLWHTVASIMGMILGLFIFIFAYKIPVLWGKKDAFEYGYGKSVKFINRHYGENGIFGLGLTWSIFGTAGIIIFLSNLYKLVFILVAPKLYLIDYFL